MSPQRRHHVVGLLDQIVDEALDPGYAAVAERRRPSALADVPEPGRDPGSAAPGRRRPRPLHLGVAAVLLLGGLLGALTLSDAREDAPDVARARAALVDRVRDATARLDARQEALDALSAQVDALRRESLSRSREGRRSADRVADLALAAGAVAVRGPGVRVTVDDAPDTGIPVDAPDLGAVQDRDLQVVANGLWAAGAEAVAVNGYRLTARTAIRAAGGVILVDFRPVVAPYRVEAVGDPRTLRAAFAEGPGGQTLQTLASRYGLRFSIEPVDELRLAAGAAVPAREGARDPEGGAR